MHDVIMTARARSLIGLVSGQVRAAVASYIVCGQYLARGGHRVRPLRLALPANT